MEFPQKIPRIYYTISSVNIMGLIISVLTSLILISHTYLSSSSLLMLSNALPQAISICAKESEHFFVSIYNAKLLQPGAVKKGVAK